MTAFGHTLMLALAATSGLNPGAETPPLGDDAFAEKETPVRVHGRLRMGGSYQKLYSVPLWLAETELGVGLRFRRHAGYLSIAFERGRSEFGLPIAAGHSSLMVESLFGRLRIGVAGRLGVMNIERTTEPHDKLRSYSMGVRLHGGLDLLLVQDTGALFAELGCRIDNYENALVWGPDLSLGFRWEP